MENTQIQIPVAKLYGWIPKVEQSIADIQAKRLSMSRGEPIIVSRLDNPRGSFFMIDGYHRAIEDILSGSQIVLGTIDIYTPRIERTGGAYTNNVNNKIRLVDAVRSIQES